MTERLRIGKITYLNLHPIFRELERLPGAHERYEIVEGYPALLNKMLRSGGIDVSPSSSAAYLKDKGNLTYIPGHSISCRGPILSILLFSARPLEELGGSQITVTHQTETSSALLGIALSRFYDLSCTQRVSQTPMYKSIAQDDAALCIGDEALFIMAGATNASRSTSAGAPHTLCDIAGRRLHVYDLGEIWQMKTGLPMVFALWTLSNDTQQRRIHEVARLRQDLDAARLKAMSEMDAAAWELGGRGLPLGADEIKAYWRTIEYALPEDCVMGLDLFGRYLLEA